MINSPTRFNIRRKTSLKTMKTFSFLFPKTRDANPNPEPMSHSSGETSGGGDGGEAPAAFASSSKNAIVSVNSDGATDITPSATSSGEGDRKRALMEKPPTDDVCPICFGDYDVPCRAPCGHWYCGTCILQYWNFSAVLQPCKCPMCSQHITKLIPELSLYHGQQEEITKVLSNVGDYNRLFVGGISGFVLKFLAIPLYMKRMFREMLNPDRPGVYLHEMRVIAMLLGILYSFIPFDFLQIGRRNIINMFDYSAFALSFILYLVGLCLRRRRRRNVIELQAGHDGEVPG